MKKIKQKIDIEIAVLTRDMCSNQCNYFNEFDEKCILFKTSIHHNLTANNRFLGYKRTKKCLNTFKR